MFTMNGREKKGTTKGKGMVMCSLRIGHTQKRHKKGIGNAYGFTKYPSLVYGRGYGEWIAKYRDGKIGANQIQ